MAKTAFKSYKTSSPQPKPIQTHQHNKPIDSKSHRELILVMSLIRKGQTPNKLIQTPHQGRLTVAGLSMVCNYRSSGRGILW